MRESSACCCTSKQLPSLVTMPSKNCSWVPTLRVVGLFVSSPILTYENQLIPFIWICMQAFDLPSGASRAPADCFRFRPIPTHFKGITIDEQYNLMDHDEHKAQEPRSVEGRSSRGVATTRRTKFDLGGGGRGRPEKQIVKIVVMKMTKKSPK